MKIRTVTLAAIASLALVGAAVADTDWEAGPIFNQGEAMGKCTPACTLTWNGQWRTTEPGKMSVCGATNAAPPKQTQDVAVGPIFNQGEAKAKCDGGLAKIRWNGQWRTTEPGRMSVCGCTGAAE
jgi:Mannan-binding protein